MSASGPGRRRRRQRRPDERCSLPVVINSGSGNQGITVTMPIVIYGRAWQADRELILRALVLANLISVHQKKYIGSLSAYCGATSAATGPPAAWPI